MVDGEIYIFGGGNDNGFTKKFERLDTASNTFKFWIKIPNMPYRAIRCASVAKIRRYM